MNRSHFLTSVCHRRRNCLALWPSIAPPITGKHVSSVKEREHCTITCTCMSVVSRLSGATLSQIFMQ